MSKTKIEEALLERPAEATGSLASKVKMHDWLLVGIVVVVVVGFAAMLITAGAMVNDSLAEKKAISQDMRDKIKDQNDKIEVLTGQTNELTKIIEDQTKVIQDVQETLQTTN